MCIRHPVLQRPDLLGRSLQPHQWRPGAQEWRMTGRCPHPGGRGKCLAGGTSPHEFCQRSAPAPNRHPHPTVPALRPNTAHQPTVLHPIPVQCASFGDGCEANADCCTGLTCSSGLCTSGNGTQVGEGAFTWGGGATRRHRFKACCLRHPVHPPMLLTGTRELNHAARGGACALLAVRQDWRPVRGGQRVLHRPRLLI